MATKAKGDERRGQDDDVGNAGLKTEKVDAASPYFERLKARLGQGGGGGTGPFEPTAAEPEEPKTPGFVIYGDDGKPIG